MGFVTRGLFSSGLCLYSQSIVLCSHCLPAERIFVGGDQAQRDLVSVVRSQPPITVQQQNQDTKSKTLNPTEGI